MIRLNLLPWREALRRQRKHQFQRQIGLVAALGLSVVLAIFMVNAERLHAQTERNQLLTTENAKLDTRIGEIKQLENQIAVLNARRATVDQLQTGRGFPVRMLDTLASRTPEGIALKSIKQTDALAITGLAQSNARVSEFLRGLDDVADWLGQPELSEIKAANLGQGREAKKIFEFSIRLLPASAEEKSK
ncbi:MAG: PilN domain-containing protein [Betaproteobacteria bacterium]